ncbi:NF038143 family protein [Desulfosediminicola flagellatus]|uniref:NF038143 family protein n=1 Tax=Desulfosediminicola flagellatus TaxID=2569541 RepID=UPI0010ABBEAD|nr:NF038143 family protein [Desulfosediminicola flagellatus]
MSEFVTEEKKQKILEYEEAMASQLARRVLEKPVPPVWMIFIPVFFVFYAWKVKEYSNGLKSFANHYLLSRRLALDTAWESVQNDTHPEIARLIEKAEIMAPEAVPLYLGWITLLTDHYRNLLTSPGKTVEEMIRNYYRNKSSYMLFSNQLNTAENTFNAALLPKIEGDQQDIHFIAARMQRSLKDLCRQEVETVFS